MDTDTATTFEQNRLHEAKGLNQVFVQMGMRRSHCSSNKLRSVLPWNNFLILMTHGTHRKCWINPDLLYNSSWGSFPNV